MPRTLIARYKGRQCLTVLNVYEEFDSLHGDPRFQDLVRRIGIPSS